MFRPWTAAVALLGLGACGSTNPGALPLLLQPPAGQAQVLEAKARGVQIYVCEADAVGHLRWVFKGPEATLFDSSGQQIGRHYAGPTWESNDGSTVVGKVTANVPSPDAASIPWLLLGATSTSGAGTLGRVASIQRIDTSGGKPGSPDCAPTESGNTLRVPYVARYVFYAKAP